jgi:hypothetical protein
MQVSLNRMTKVIAINDMEFHNDGISLQSYCYAGDNFK